MKKRSKRRERKNAKREKKKKMEHERERKTAAGRTSRVVLRTALTRPRALGNLVYVDSIDTVRPNSDEDCICGSRLRFGDCCASRLADGPAAMAKVDRLLESNQFALALTWCRAHLSWYILAHRAHTVPRLKEGDLIAKEILAVDVEALDGLLHRLKRCYRATGQGDAFRHVLVAMSDVVKSRQWTDKLALHWALWWELEKNDRERAAEYIAGVDAYGCRDAEVLAKYVTLRARQMPFDERVTLMSRVCEITEEQPIKFQFRCLVGIAYLLIREHEKAVELITSAADQYRSLSENHRSWFGDHLFAMTLFLLGSLQDSDELVAEAEKCFSDFLAPERAASLTPLGKSECHMHVGRCKAFLGEYDLAIEKYNESLAIYELTLAKIYKAEALISGGEADAGRELLERIDSQSLSLENRHDYAMARTLLAVATQLEADINCAKLALKAFDSNDPLWVQQRDKWLITLLETVPIAKAGLLLKLIRKINRYFILQPNFFGLGININNAFEDLGQSHD